MSGLQYQRVRDFFDVLIDGTVIGTTHMTLGGWVFYKGPVTGIPTSIGTSRQAAVELGLRLTAGEPSPEITTNRMLTPPE